MACRERLLSTPERRRGAPVPAPVAPSGRSTGQSGDDSENGSHFQCYIGAAFVAAAAVEMAGSGGTGDLLVSSATVTT